MEEDKKKLNLRDLITFINVEEWGILLVIVPTFRHTTFCCQVQNRPTKDQRVNLVEPRALEALKVSFKSEI